MSVKFHSTGHVLVNDIIIDKFSTNLMNNKSRGGKFIHKAIWSEHQEIKEWVENNLLGVPCESWLQIHSNVECQTNLHIESNDNILSLEAHNIMNPPIWTSDSKNRTYHLNTPKRG